MKAILLISSLFWWAWAAADAPSPRQDPVPLWDADPKHLWNLLEDALFVRTAVDQSKYGLDELDILYWDNTKHLLAGPSYTAAVRVLDRFINVHGERLIRDPLKRALLQRDLWQLFDWAARPEYYADLNREKVRAELQGRLSIVIRRLALTPAELETLPNNYSDAERGGLSVDLPRGMLEPDGDWVIVGDRNSGDAAAPEHMMDFGGRSTFVVLAHFPQGREQALAYLDQLRHFEHPRIITKLDESRERVTTNPAVPQFPLGTEWALMRRMCVIDIDGRIQPTALVESLQVRRYLSIPATDQAGRILDPTAIARPTQQFREFEMDRRHEAILRGVSPDEKDFQFVHFRSMGADAFESMNDSAATQNLPSLRSKTLDTCTQCHSAPGLLSVESYSRNLSTPSWQSPDFSPSTLPLQIAYASSWKERQFDWGLLQGLWRNARTGRLSL